MSNENSSTRKPAFRVWGILDGDNGLTCAPGM